MYVVSYHPSLCKFIKTLPKKSSAKLDTLIRLLEKHGKETGMPYLRFLFDGWYEIRVHGKQEIRVFLVFKEDQILLMHGYIKKTQKLLLRELATAQQRLKLLTK